MKKANKPMKEDEETCPKCLGAGDLPGKRGNHSSISEIKKCWKCQGTGKIKKQINKTEIWQSRKQVIFLKR